MLSSVFLQPAPLPLLPAGVLAALRADPRVEAAVPVGFGDFIGTYPIVGTTPDAIAMLGGLAEGDGFEHLADAVAGAQVTRHIGTSFRPFHGTAWQPGEVHEEAEYRIVGRMALNGTPWDRAILVPIQSVWDVHAEHEYGHSHAEEHEHYHDGGFASRAVDDAALADSANPGVPAIVVKPRSISDAYNLRQHYRAETTTAVFPGEVLTRL